MAQLQHIYVTAQIQPHYYLSQLMSYKKKATANTYISLKKQRAIRRLINKSQPIADYTLGIQPSMARSECAEDQCFFWVKLPSALGRTQQGRNLRGTTWSDT